MLEQQRRRGSGLPGAGEEAVGEGRALDPDAEAARTLRQQGKIHQKAEKQQSHK
jgi:hypothetical protein